MRAHHRSFHTFFSKYISTDKIILELGSGAGTVWLVDNGYTVYSVEHDLEFMNRDDRVNYIYSPLKGHKPVEGFRECVWYDPETLKNLPKHDVILIDGPPGCEGRVGFFKYLDLFNENALMIFDDVQRRNERLLISRVSRRLRRPYYVEPRIKRTTFGVILPDGWDWKPYEDRLNG